VIWARPLSLDGGSQAALVRSGFAPGVGAAVFQSLERLALMTGLDEASRALLVATAGSAWLGGRGDAGLVRWSPMLLDVWRPALERAPELVGALARLRSSEEPLPATVIGPTRFEWGARTYVMGILNVTPDSFSDGGRFASLDAAMAQAESLVAAGVDLLDVGGESTRPGAPSVPEDEELCRVVPVIEALARRWPRLPLSIDTSKPLVARRAVEAGAHLVNDVTGLEREEMVALVAELGVAACAMHMRGSPRTMQLEPVYDDVVAEVLDFLEARLRRAEAAGIARTRVLVDVGIGFGKTFEHNLFLLRHAPALRLLGAPVLMGTSRKAFLGALTGKAPLERDGASAAVVAAIAARGGADLVRVHDVASAREAAAVAEAVAQASHGGRLFEPTTAGPEAVGVEGVGG